MTLVFRHNFTSTSSNIIYCISCLKCRKVYIGETGRSLSDRFPEHLRSVRNDDVDKPVARHFNAANHSISDGKMCPVSPISGGKDSRKEHEKSLIFKIGIVHHHGLNERFSWSHPFIVSVHVLKVHQPFYISTLLTRRYVYREGHFVGVSKTHTNYRSVPVLDRYNEEVNISPSCRQPIFRKKSGYRNIQRRE